MTGPHGTALALGADGVWIQMSTVGVAWNERLEFVAGEHELLFVDAPVSGSDRSASDGLLVILASGDEAEALGLEPGLFIEAIDKGPLASAFAVKKDRAMLARDFEPGFPLRHALKHVRLSLEAVADGGSDPVLVAAVAARFAQALDLGHGGDDVAAVISAAA